MFGKRREKVRPLKEKDRVITLKARGRGNLQITPLVVISFILAVFCLCYCAAVFFMMGYGTKFFLVWGVLGVFFGIVTCFLANRAFMEKLSKKVKVLCVVLTIIALCIFGIVEGMIFRKYDSTALNRADYIVILGAQWKSSGPSYILQLRLDKALEYLNDSPETKIIVSGGQGSNEPISEAEGMKEYLVNKGIDPERIILEDKSTSTVENLEFSSKYLDKKQDRVVLVTNNYHVFRAEKIAKKMGYEKVEGLAARSHLGMLPNNLLREFLAILKDFWVGNI